MDCANGCLLPDPAKMISVDTLISDRFVDFEKPAGVDTDGGVRFFLDWDPMPNGRHYVQIALDYATLGSLNGVQARGSYLAVYDNKIDKDFVKYGCVWPWSGSVAFGADAIIPGCQFSVHDFTWINQSIDIWSNKDGVRVNSRAADCDCLTVQRDDTPLCHWYHYHQGNGSHDWRWGMMPDTYDLAFYTGNGNMGCSASQPGIPALIIKEDGTLVNKTISDLEQRIANLEAKIRSIEK